MDFKDNPHISLLLQYADECYENLQRGISCYEDSGNIDLTLNFIELALQSSKLAGFFYYQNFKQGELQVFEDYINEFMALCTGYLTDFKKEEELTWSPENLESMKVLLDQLHEKLS